MMKRLIIVVFALGVLITTGCSSTHLQAAYTGESLASQKKLSVSACNHDRWEGIGGYGVEVGRMIEDYEDKRNLIRSTYAALAFTHVFYANGLALAMVPKVNNGLSVSYYCQSKAKSNSIKELELFIAWVKLQADEDESVLKDPIVVIYPVYLMSQYPMSTCPSSG